jgi:hypothetical protein
MSLGGDHGEGGVDGGHGEEGARALQGGHVAQQVLHEEGGAQGQHVGHGGAEGFFDGEQEADGAQVAFGVAVVGAGAGEHDDAAQAAGLAVEEVGQASDVLGLVGHEVGRGEPEELVGALEGGVEGGGVVDGSDDDAGAAGGQGSGALGVAADDGDGRARGEELVDDDAADVAVGGVDDDGHRDLQGQR